MQLVGGLGNQMFISAMGWVTAASSQKTLVFDTSVFRRQDSRRFELGAFPKLSAVVQSRMAFGRPHRALDRALAEFGVSTPGLFVQQGAFFDPRIDQIARASRVRGYFQSWRYFADHESEVRSLFDLQRGTDLDSLLQAEVGDAFIAVHVRRGDYLKPAVAAFHGLCSSAYFTREIRNMRMERPGLPVVCFTDSAADIGGEVVQACDFVVEGSRTRSPADDLVAMSRASALVMSNSSYSWWAAYLGQRDDRPVVAPVPWLASGYVDTESLLLPAWRLSDAR